MTDHSTEHENNMTPDNSDEWEVPDDGKGFGRRTIIKGAAWSVPVIALAVASPAAAASGGIALIVAPPATTTCTAFGDIIFQMTPAPPGGTSVLVTLGSGLRYSDLATGTRAFFTDADGKITISGVQAADKGSFTVTAATQDGAVANATLTATTLDGVLYRNGVLTQIPQADNNDFVRVYDGDLVATAIRNNGDVWNWDGDVWTLVGTGALTGSSQAASRDSVPESIYITTGGVLYSNGQPSSIPTSDNTDFIHVYGGADTLTAVKGNGDVWNWNGSTWSLIGTGALIGPSQAAARLTLSESIYIGLNGVLYTNGNPSRLPAGTNNSFIRVYAANTTITAIKSNGDVWLYDDAASAWSLVGTGGYTGPNQGAVRDAATEALYITTGGVLYRNGTPSAIPAADNADFVRVYGGGDVITAVKGNGDVWNWNGSAWAKVGVGALIGESQASARVTKQESHYIVNNSTCI
jgi:hypothetical protein